MKCSYEVDIKKRENSIIMQIGLYNLFNYYMYIHLNNVNVYVEAEYN